MTWTGFAMRVMPAGIFYGVAAFAGGLFFTGNHRILLAAFLTGMCFGISLAAGNIAKEGEKKS